MKVCIIGTTSWGTTLGVMLARRGVSLMLWARTEAEAAALNAKRANELLLPDIAFPEGLVITSSLEEGLRDSNLLIMAVPSHSMRQNLRKVRNWLKEPLLILSAVKGLEAGTAKRMSEIIAEELDQSYHSSICVLSGPNLSKEIAKGLLATSVVASREEKVAKQVQEILMSPTFRVYTNRDVIGVELGGALKNIIAIAAGMCEGLEYGDNAKAALMTRGLAEITRLGVAAGANPLTFAGLAGLGDLVATCSSPLSRNHHVGYQLAKGQTLKEITISMPYVAEGINTTVAARMLAQRMGVEMPITEYMYKVLFEGMNPRQAVVELMAREARPEFAGII